MSYYFGIKGFVVVVVVVVMSYYFEGRASKF
jgi:hypothetical protein